jgi:hypothetical protein
MVQKQMWRAMHQPYGMKGWKIIGEFATFEEALKAQQKVIFLNENQRATIQQVWRVCRDDKTMHYIKFEDALNACMQEEVNAVL